LFDHNPFKLMADTRARIKGTFILSINNVAQIRDLFSHFTVLEVDVRYSCTTNNNYIGKELIITNQKEVTIIKNSPPYQLMLTVIRFCVFCQPFLCATR